MARNFFRSLALVSIIALLPAATTSGAQQEIEASRQFKLLLDIWQKVHANYVDKVDDKALIRGAIDGMLSSLDPHSSYLDEKGYDDLMTQTDGEYGGLGLNVTMEDGAVKVVAATEDTPAHRAGIKAGDYITHINGNLINGVTLDEAVSEMRGAPGTPIKITIFRAGRDKPFDVTITRAIIELPAVKWEIKNRVGILNINSFNKKTTDLVEAAIQSIDKKLGGRPLGYVVDLRSNPGGLLDQAVGVADLFLERGEIVSQRGRAPDDIERYFARLGDSARGLPIVVLVDSGSASAAEIVAGALQDHHRALVMGEQSFGKGSVQSLIDLGSSGIRGSTRTGLRLTTARYYTPSGRSVQEGGITPDLRVPQLSDPDYKNRPGYRESDLRRHLVNERKTSDAILQDDGKPDPRFTASADQLKKQGVDDFQLSYAVNAIARLGRVQSATAQPRRRPAG